jgi:hypothetical protein
MPFLAHLLTISTNHPNTQPPKTYSPPPLSAKFKKSHFLHVCIARREIKFPFIFKDEMSFFDVHVTVHRDKFLIITQLDALISQIYLGKKLYLFRTVPLSIIMSFSLYTQQWCVSYRFADSSQAVSKPV